VSGRYGQSNHHRGTEGGPRYAEDIHKLEEAGPNPQYRITAAQISRLIETLEVLRDQCTAMISSYGNDK
jgi:hypothetical protein